MKNEDFFLTKKYEDCYIEDVYNNCVYNKFC